MEQFTRSVHKAAKHLKPFNDFIWQTYTQSRRGFGPVDSGQEMSAVDFCQCEFNDFVTDVHRFIYHTRSFADTIKTIPEAATLDQVDLGDPELVNAVRDRYLEGNDQGAVRGILIQYGLDPLVVEGMDRRLVEAQGEWRSLIPGLEADTVLDALHTLPSLLNKFADAVERYVQEELLDVDDDEEATVASASMALISDDGSVSIDCEWIEDEDARWICYIIGVVVIVVALLIIVVNALAEWIDWIQRDDRVRAEVSRRSCSEISSLDTTTLIGWIDVMLDGPTLDDDERAILRILSCVADDCARMRNIVDSVGRHNLMDDIDGREWDRLMILLQRCSIVDFRAWDDDATRRFINESSCATINSLSLTEIRQLMINLFEGDTGDADERAIIHVMRCLPCARRRRLMTMSGVRFSNFDSEVHGSEWTTLRPLLRC